MNKRSQIYCLLWLICITPILLLASSSDNFIKSQITDFDSLNVRFIGNWPYGPAITIVHDNARNYVYASTGGGVVIIDDTDPNNPIEIARFKTRGLVSGLSYVATNQVLYIATGLGGLEIWNLSNVNSPSRIGFLYTSDRAYGVVVIGSYAYIADGGAGIQIVNISNPANPVLIGSCNTPGTAYKIDVVGSYAYVADGPSGIRIINVANPANPYETGSLVTPGWARGIYVVGNYAYVADDYYGLRVINIANPVNPVEVGYYDTPGYSYGVFVAGSYAYVADFSEGLQIININNPANPVLVGSYNTAGSARSVFVTGSYAYVADDNNGLVIIDVSNPTNPVLVGNLSSSGWTCDVTVVGSYCYMADGSGGLRVINVNNPYSPYEVGHYQTPDYAFGLAALGVNYIACACHRAGLQIYRNLIFGVDDVVFYSLSNGGVTARPIFFSNTIELKINRPILSTVKVVIYDACGKIIHKNSYPVQAQSVRIASADLQSVSQGVYFCAVLADEVLIGCAKLIKL